MSDKVKLQDIRSDINTLNRNSQRYQLLIYAYNAVRDTDKAIRYSQLSQLTDSERQRLMKSLETILEEARTDKFGQLDNIPESVRESIQEL